MSAPAEPNQTPPASEVARARQCPACGGTAFHPHINVRGIDVLKCGGCGLATWDWSGFNCATFYNEDYWRSAEVSKGYADYFDLARATKFTSSKRLRWIRRILRRRGGDIAAVRSPRLLDAGCGPGFFVQAASSAGFEAHGVEVSEYAVKYARETLRQHVWQGQVRGGDLGPGPYDVVTMWDVIEHLPDPADALRAVAGVLPNGGVLLLSTGDVGSLVARLSGAKWHLYTLPEHLWFFNRRSLELLLRASGFDVLECRYEWGWYTLRYLVERLEASLGMQRRLSRLLGPLGRVPLPVTLADIVTVVARRR